MGNFFGKKSTGAISENKGALNRYLNPIGVWALSFGCAVGWGAFVMPATSFVPIAGPIGSVIGFILGAIVMLLIGANYHYMIVKYPDSGGSFSFAKKCFGYDHGFINAWFLILTYLAVLWANAAAIPLIINHLANNALKVGPHYEIFGYAVYLTEIAIPIATVVVFGLACLWRKKITQYLQIGFAGALFIGVLVCFILVLINRKGGIETLAPHFSENGNPFLQIVSVIALAPWAYVGFESISNSAGEFKFKTKYIFVIIILALFAGAFVYAATSVISVSFIPEGSSTWVDYFANKDSMDGLKDLPTFYAAHEAMGNVGLIFLIIAALGGILTALIANFVAGSRLIYSLSEERLLPKWFGKLNRFNAPRNAILVMMGISIVIPFFGRTAISWIVDVTTIGASIIYLYTSATSFKTARQEHNKLMQVIAIAGMLLSAFFLIYFMMPFVFGSKLATESYLILIIRAILGVIVFRIIYTKDVENRLGTSPIVWIVLLLLIFITSVLWMRQSAEESTTKTILSIQNKYREDLEAAGISGKEELIEYANIYFKDEMNRLNNSLLVNSIVQLFLVAIATILLFNIYSIMQKREKKTQLEKLKAEESSKAKSSFLSNMSHDIRTPMNAIVGYTALAKKEKNLSPEISDYLTKIENSSQHLLSLINDILDMSRIESGKFELDLTETNLSQTLQEIYDIFVTQMNGKNIEYTVDTSSIKNKYVLCDKKRLNRILLNLISNAYKFTPEGGKVNVILNEINTEENSATYEIRVKDTGIGMSQEFVKNVFNAFERERDKTVKEIQGSGLGMSIAKNLVDLMGGQIEVLTEKGKGTEFIITLTFDFAKDIEKAKEETINEEKTSAISFKGMRLLLVDDNEINREIASLILADQGFEIEEAENGEEAFNKVKNNPVGYYQIVLMDVMMPIMNGYDASRNIRSLEGEYYQNLPIIALSANAFNEDIEDSKQAGMNAHLSKPIDVQKLISTLTDLLSNK